MRRGATRKKTRKLKPSAVAGWRRALSHLFGAGLAAAFLGLLLVAGQYLVSLPVERVVVSGELVHVDRAELRAMISQSLAGGFLLQDLQTLREPLEAMPWVYRAVVRRQWPASIEVRVIEQRPIARWREDALLNQSGEVFSPATLDGVASLPALAGPEGSHGLMMRRYLQVQGVLQGLGLRLDRLSMDDRGAVTATLSDGSQLLFGREGLDEKLERLRILYSTRLAARRAELARIDLRYAHGAAVAWRGAPGRQEDT
jgi:cell division protein FtsQ